MLKNTVFFVLLFASVFSNNEIRYITYSVNYGEGFNLRRDVYMRAASLVLDLRRQTDLNWVLVLPPWPRLYHWKSSQYNQNSLSWSRFFDLDEMSKVVPCIEYDSYVNTEGRVIEELLQLQPLPEPFKDGKFVEKVEEIKCQNIPKVVFGDSRSVQVKTKTCVFAQGRIPVMTNFLKERQLAIKSFLIQDFQTFLHADFGGIEYWKIRGSMVYSSVLREAGNRYMINKLNYNPGKGNGRLPLTNQGGQYIGAHLRREDFLYHYKDTTIPSFEGVVNQLQTLLQEQNLKVVFIASDASINNEFQQALSSLDAQIHWYKPTADEIEEYGDGGIAIIDQWILSHAKYFIGTSESTFSFRVREDRQFMGFSVESTFNDFCGPSADENDPHSCPKPIKRLLVKDIETKETLPLNAKKSEL